MFYFRIDKNSKHDSLKQLSQINFVAGLSIQAWVCPVMSEHDTSYVCMNQFDVYPRCLSAYKKPNSHPYSFFRYCQYCFDIPWACLTMTDIYICEPLYPRFLRYCWFIIIFWYSVMLDHPHLKYLDQFVVSRVAYPYTKNERHNWISIYTPLCLYSVLIRAFTELILEILTIYHFKVLCT